MIIILGAGRKSPLRKIMDKNSFVVADADILVALYFKKDALRSRVADISRKFLKTGVRVIFPNTAIAEAITTMQRKLSNSTAADLLNQDYKQGILEVEYVDEGIMRGASEFFNPHGSKKNTFFDALVAATAKSLNSDTIFSFDTWYKKLGFNLAEDLK